jgi:hypothetical protein
MATAGDGLLRHRWSSPVDVGGGLLQLVQRAVGVSRVRASIRPAPAFGRARRRTCRRAARHQCCWRSFARATRGPSPASASTRALAGILKATGRLMLEVRANGQLDRSAPGMNDMTNEKDRRLGVVCHVLGRCASADAGGGHHHDPVSSPRCSPAYAATRTSSASWASSAARAAGSPWLSSRAWPSR